MKIELTEEQRNNLLIFLDRVTLQGKEVIAFTQIVHALQNPLEKEQPKKVGD